MKERITGIIIAVGIFLIVTTFNPFTLPSLYLDSSQSFSFIALHKVSLLALLNIILLVIVGVKTIKRKTLAITSSKIALPALAVLIVAIISTFFSINTPNSIFGFNAAFSFSLFETIMLITFFFLLSNVIHTTVTIQRIIRYTIFSFLIIFLYSVLKYAFSWQVESIYFAQYINSFSFTLSGNSSSLTLLSLVMLHLCIGLVVMDVSQQNPRWLFIFDAVSLVISGACFIVFLNVSSPVQPTFYIVAAIASLLLIGYVLFTSERLRKAVLPLAILLIFSVSIGFTLYFGLTRDTQLAYASPRVPFDLSWNVTVESWKGSVSRGFVGNGQGNYTYLFDAYKDESAATAQNLTFVNSNPPYVPETRLNHAGSFFLEILSANGLLGLLAYGALFVLTATVGIKKMGQDAHPFSLFTLIACMLVGAGFFVTGYDFILLFLLWFLLAATIIFFHENEPQKELNISLAGKFDSGHNFNYVIPILLLLASAIIFYFALIITIANQAAFEAKRREGESEIAGYAEHAFKATQRFNRSDVFIRELVNANSIIFFEEMNALNKDLEENPDTKETPETQQRISELNTYSNLIVSDMDYAIELFPQEYRNYYLKGGFLLKTSEYSELALDESAANNLYTSLERNPYHAPTYFNLALLFERNKQYETAYNHIQKALQYENTNLNYLLKKADLLVEIENFDDAIKIYQAFQQLELSENAVPNREEFKTNITRKIEAAGSKKEEKLKKDESAQATPAEDNTPSLSPTDMPAPVENEVSPSGTPTTSPTGE